MVVKSSRTHSALLWLLSFSALGYCRAGGSAKSNDTSRMDVSQRGMQRSSIKSGLGQPPAKQRPDGYQTAPVGFFPVKSKSV